MELFLMTITTGVMVGGIYALVALGWVLIYKCSGVLNLAMGEMTLIGAYTSLSFYSMGVPFLASLGISLVIGFILGILTERIFLDKLIGEPVLAVIMVTVGLSFFFKGIVELIWGTDTRVFDPSGKIPVQIRTCQILQNADGDATDNGAGYGVEPAQNNGRQDQKPQIADRDVQPIDVAQKCPPDAGSHECDGPGRCIDKPGTDTDRKGSHFIIGGCLHGQSPLGVLEKTDKNDKKNHGGHKTPDIDLSDHNGP